MFIWVSQFAHNLSAWHISAKPQTSINVVTDLSVVSRYPLEVKLFTVAGEILQWLPKVTSHTLQHSNWRQLTIDHRRQLEISQSINFMKVGNDYNGLGWYNLHQLFFNDRAVSVIKYLKILKFYCTTHSTRVDAHFFLRTSAGARSMWRIFLFFLCVILKNPIYLRVAWSKC